MKKCRDPKPKTVYGPFSRVQKPADRVHDRPVQDKTREEVVDLPGHGVPDIAPFVDDDKQSNSRRAQSAIPDSETTFARRPRRNLDFWLGKEPRHPKRRIRKTNPKAKHQGPPRKQVNAQIGVPGGIAEPRLTDNTPSSLVSAMNTRTPASPGKAPKAGIVRRPKRTREFVDLTEDVDGQALKYRKLSEDEARELSGLPPLKKTFVNLDEESQDGPSTDKSH